MKQIIFIFMNVIFVGVLIIALYLIGAFCHVLEFQKTTDEIDLKTGKITYRLRASHWYHADLIRCEYYYNLTEKGCDSIIQIERQAHEILKNLKK